METFYRRGLRLGEAGQTGQFSGLGGLILIWTGTDLPQDSFQVNFGWWVGFQKPSPFRAVWFVVSRFV